jgi:ABC-type bacteriocin/lantibiotic exporter with double-glycine peptidase domain
MAEEPVTIVWQEPSLFRGTILENLRMGSMFPNRDAIERATGVCQLESLIKDLPMRCESATYEWGASLSAGQQQRVALARALVRNTPILLLYETASHIDRETEIQMIGSIVAEYERTIVFTTHRYEVANLADVVLTVDRGMIEVAEWGSACRSGQRAAEYLLEQGIAGTGGVPAAP